MMSMIGVFLETLNSFYFPLDQEWFEGRGQEGRNRKRNIPSHRPRELERKSERDRQKETHLDNTWSYRSMQTHYGVRREARGGGAWGRGG